jgi:uncharacterized membrane protein
MIVIAAILAIALANYMFFQHNKRKMREEDRRNERRERFYEMLKKNKKEDTGNDNPDASANSDH